MKFYRSIILLFLLFFVNTTEASIRSDATGEGIIHTAQGVDWDDAGVTIMSWIYITTDRAADTAFVTIRGAGILYVTSTRELAIYVGDSTSYFSGQTLSVGVWYHVALTRSGLTWTGYLNGTQAVQGNALSEPTGDPQPYFGNNQYGDWLNGREAHGRIWLATLTQTEIAAEKNLSTPSRTTNIWFWSPFVDTSDLNDHSGLGNNPTSLGGTLTTESDPPLQVGRTAASGRVVISTRDPITTRSAASGRVAVP